MNFNSKAFTINGGGTQKECLVSQDHSQNITLNDRYIYENFFLVDFFSLDIYIFFIKMMVIFYDLDD